MKILVTGTAGFIGHHLALRLVERGDEVVGLDNINDYYDVRFKYGRLAQQGISPAAVRKDPFPGSGTEVPSDRHPNLRFVRLCLSDAAGVLDLFRRERFDRVCNLAAQAGVRYSLTNPHAYVRSNIEGFLNLLEACRHYEVEHLVFASSSSVYGLNETMPFSTRQNVDHPISLYAASKKSDELMAHTYSHLFNVPATGLRFFTVYGPWGRPDMALFLFTQAMLAGRPIDIFNHGDQQRDFTYIDDIVEGVVRVIDRAPQGNPDWSGLDPDPASARAPYKLYNIGHSSPVKLMDFIAELEKQLGVVAQKNFLPMQPGDVRATYADISELRSDFNFQPQTSVQEGIERFVKWYREFHPQLDAFTASADRPA